MALELVPTMDTQLTSFTVSQFQDLEQPLNEKVIKERQGPGGKMLKYISGKTAIDTANRIFGIGKWGYRVLSLTREMAGEQTFYTADVELYVQGCPFPFPGQGEGVPQRDTADQYAKARKEAVTDALKRALRHFGDQFGLALYDEESLVEDANGELKKVKDVHPHQQNGNTKPTPPPLRKMVDAIPQLSLEQLQALCEELFGPGKWSKLRVRVLPPEEVGDISDAMLSQAHLARIYNALDAHQKQKAKPAS